MTISTEQKGDLYKIHISNNGDFLPEEMQERLFDSMVSIRSASHNNNGDKQPHLGLGLYMARLICEFHHGKISAVNHHNPKGVTVTITLPINSH